MAISDIVRNYRDGTIVLSDNTAVTPLSITVQYEAGDLSIDGIGQDDGKAYAITAYQDRGEIATVRKTSRELITFQFSGMITTLDDPSGTDETFVDIITKNGAFAAGVSTINADVWGIKLVWTVDGTAFGETDRTITIDKAACTISIAEGDPDTYTISGTSYADGIGLT